MRLRSRKAPEEERAEQEMLPATLASDSTASVGQQPALPSKRLQRIADYVRAQAELLEQMRAQLQEELQPLNELLVRQAQTMQQMLVNLEERLRPLNEYADGEEANLDGLERRMGGESSDFVSRSFASYLAEQRRRISETRRQIDQQRVPFLQFAEDQRDVVEIALARFDEDMEALEVNLSEQRRVLMHMLDAMRSDSFVAVKEFLSGREDLLAELASSGATDPGDVGRSIQALRQSVEQIARESTHIQSVLSSADEADKRLVKSAPPGPRALPKQQAEPEAEATENEPQEVEASA